MSESRIEELEDRIYALEKTIRVLRGLIGRLDSRADFLEARL